MKPNEPNDQASTINKGMVLGYLLRSPQPEFSINISRISEVLTLTALEVNNALMMLLEEQRITLTISRAIVQLRETIND